MVLLFRPAFSVALLSGLAQQPDWGLGASPIPGTKLVGGYAGPVFASAGYSVTHGIAYFAVSLEKDTPDSDDTEDTEARTPGDPNEKTGPLGYGPNGLISATQPISYTITFVNASSNTAPAHLPSVSLTSLI